MAQTVRVDWYGDELVKAVERHTPDALFAMGNVVLDAAKPRAPKRTGTLAASGYVGTKTRSSYRPKRKVHRKEIKIKAETVAVVAFAAYYQHFIEGGTDPHPIPKRRKKGKRPMKIPKIGYRWLVQHPGIEARPFLGPAVNATRSAMVKELTGRLRQKLEA